MKIYTIIGGINGVGKSSFTGVLKGSRNDLGQIIDVDKITAQLGGDTLEAMAELDNGGGNPFSGSTEDLFKL